MYGSTHGAVAGEIPAHVPQPLVFDFDIHSDPRLVGDVHEVYQGLLRDAPDIFYTSRNGGHWMMTRYDDVAMVMRRQEIFSSAETVVPVPSRGLKVTVTPLDMDDPDHRKIRKLLDRFLGPSAIAKREREIREFCIEMIDDLAPKGHCEFVSEFSMPMPVLSFMNMMQWDPANYAELVHWIHIFGSNATDEERGSAMRKLNVFLTEMIDRLAVAPGDDPLSFLLQSEVDGVRLTKAQVVDIGNLLFMGGLDTVTNAMSYIVRYLSENPEIQQRLRDNPAIIKDSINELMRRVAFVHTARIVKSDTRYKGVEFKQGDIVVGSLCTGSNDPRAYECPMQVDLDRKGAPPHLAFNTGAHNCAGVHFAKLELKIWLEEWLKRIPTFRVKDGFFPTFRAGQVMGMNNLELEW